MTGVRFAAFVSGACMMLAVSDFARGQWFDMSVSVFFGAIGLWASFPSQTLTDDKS